MDATTTSAINIDTLTTQYEATKEEEEEKLEDQAATDTDIRNDNESTAAVVSSTNITTATTGTEIALPSTTSTTTSSSSSLQQTSTMVYIPSKEYAWLPARIISSETNHHRSQTTAKTGPTKKNTSTTNNNTAATTTTTTTTVIVVVSIPKNKAIPEAQQQLGLSLMNSSTRSSSSSHHNQYHASSSVSSVSLLMTEQRTIVLQEHEVLPLQNIIRAPQPTNDTTTTPPQEQLQFVTDLADLPFLHEAAILYTIKYRHAILQQPYTRTGPNGTILIAVNPYQWYHDLYTIPVQQQYAQAIIYNNNNSSNSSDNCNAMISSLEPHVYETSSYAYRGLCMGEGDQSILVSGESGAGKTETVKLLLNDLATVQLQGAICHDPLVTMDGHKNNNDESLSSSPIVQRILDSNPLLEAFGNAKTIRNDNSSRFGKYIQLQFHVEDAITAAYRGKSIPSCLLIGSRCEVYLLEKSRVVHHDSSSHERTYHIFYQLLATSDEYKATIWDGLINTDNESYNYIGYTPTTVIEGKPDAERFHQTIQSLALVGIVDDQLRTLLRALCVVLQLGNLIFTDSSSGSNNSDNVTDNDTTNEAASEQNVPIAATTTTDTMIGSKIDNMDDCIALAELMGVEHNLLYASLTVRTVRAGAKNEIFKVPLSMTAAKDSCDAFAKEIYAKIFIWLVRSINTATCAENNYTPPTTTTTHEAQATNIAKRRPQQSQPQSGSSTVSSSEPYGIIGLLDIFGFESFVTNRFEQLCINYANEKLQQKFTQDIFRNVQLEYEYEGIALNEITYDDNTDVLDLVEGRMGLIAFLNEECVRPGGSDKGFVTKTAAMNKDNVCFIRENSYTDHQFGIHHYAGRVVYNAMNFVTKNMDTLPTDLQDCAMKSTNSIITNEFRNSTNHIDDDSPARQISTAHNSAPVAARRKAPSAAVATSASACNMLTSPVKRNKGGGNLLGETVWSKFRNQLTTLMTNLKQTKTRYIRCIKPNTMKQPYIMEHVSTVEQLRCAGVVAAVTISRSAFPNRLEHDIVLDRFKSLWIKGEQIHYPIPNASLSPNDRAKDMVCQLLTSALKSLENTGSKESSAPVIQAFVLGKTRTYFRSGALEFLEHERIRCLSNWAIVIQRIIRTYVVKSRYSHIRKSIILLQSGFRMALVRQKYIQKRTFTTSIQCWVRQIIAYRALIILRRNFNATRVQSLWRMINLACRYKRQRQSVIVIQKIVRGALQRPKYRQALIDRREEAKLENQVIALQRKLEEAERRRMEAERKAEDNAQVVVTSEVKRESTSPKSAEEKKDDEKINIAGDESETSSLTNPDEPKTPRGLSSQQQALMDESGKMLEYLRKEVFKLRSHNAQLHSDFNLLKDNNQRLMDANASAGASFAALNQHAKKLSKVNEKLLTDIQSYKQQVQKLSVTQVELKEELKMKQATYVAEVHSRLQYQKALSKIIDNAQDRCRDDRLVEDFLRIADSCEAEYMNGPTGMNSRAGSTLFSPPRAGSKPNTSATSNDSSVLSSFRKMWS